MNNIKIRTWERKGDSSERTCKGTTSIMTARNFIGVYIGIS
jgi:hypothetical protein